MHGELPVTWGSLAALQVLQQHRGLPGVEAPEQRQQYKALYRLLRSPW